MNLGTKDNVHSSGVILGVGAAMCIVHMYDRYNRYVGKPSVRAAQRHLNFLVSESTLAICRKYEVSKYAPNSFLVGGCFPTHLKNICECQIGSFPHNIPQLKPPSFDSTTVSPCWKSPILHSEVDPPAGGHILHVLLRWAIPGTLENKP